MNKKEILRDIENMDAVMLKTSRMSDIWQDRFIYWIAKAVRDLLIERIRNAEQ